MTIRRVGMMVLLVVALVTAWLLNHRVQSQRAHSEIARLRSSLHPEMNTEGVVRVVAAGEYSHLAPISRVQNALAITSFPGLWPGKNWVLWLSTRDDRVVAVRVRTSDTTSEKPEGSPEDLIWGKEPERTPFQVSGRLE